MKDKTKILTIEVGDGGWVIRDKGMAPKLFFRWDSVTNYLRDMLTVPVGGGKEGK